MAKKKRNISAIDQGAPWLGDIRERARDNFEKNKRYLGYHSVVFFSTNVFLILLNLFLAGGFPWSYFITVAWGIGYVAHFQVFLNSWNHVRRLVSLTHVSKEQYVLLHEYMQVEDAFAQHRTTFLSVIGAFAGINLIVSPQFLWFIILCAGWGTGFIAHLVWYLVRRSYAKRILKEYGISWKLFGRIRVSKKARNTLAHYYEDANTVKKVIINEIRNSARLKQELGGREPLLEHFTNRMRELVQKEQAITELLESVSIDQVAEELASFKTSEGPRRKNTDARTGLAADHHRKSLFELEERRESIGRRLSSSLSLLERLRSETVRGKNGSANGKLLLFAEVEDKSEELGHYLKDLRKNL
jgi:hypothetical protein